MTEPLNNAPLTTTPPPAGKPHDPLDNIASALRDSFNRVAETVNQAVEKAVNVKDTTVVARLSDDTSEKLDLLVQSGVFKNRMEAAAFLLEEGIKNQAPLFQRINDRMAEIERLRADLRNTISSNT
jgi:hypothetical protein